MFVATFQEEAGEARSVARDAHGHAEAALDALAIGAVVCDATGAVLHANAAGERLVCRADGLAFQSHPRRLVAVEPRVGAALRGHIAAAAEAGLGGALAVSDADDERLLVLVSPTIGDRALVLLRSTARDQSPAHTVLRALFSLTPTEAALAAALVKGDSALELAAARRVSESTLRTHLASIFRKTGVDGQRDLVRLLSLLPPVHLAPA